MLSLRSANGGRQELVRIMGSKKNKQHRRRVFEVRHVDQVWRDAQKKKLEVCNGVSGPVGTTDKVELDADIPGRGQHYCVPCSRYFISAASMVKHESTKLHKRRAKLLATMGKPHGQDDANAAGDMGKPDNGISTRMMTG